MIEIQVEGTCWRCLKVPAELVLLRTDEDGDDKAMCLKCFRKLLDMAEKLEVLQGLQGSKKP